MKLTEFKDAYQRLINLAFGELNNDQKRTVYAMEIYNDSQDALTACDLYADKDLPEDRRLPDEYIDDQLRNTFDYNDTTIIE